MASERRALCSACLRPLSGSLVASRCNHVFHRGCLQGPDGASCRKCGTENVKEGALELFGLQFEEDDFSLLAAASRAQPTVVVDLDSNESQDAFGDGEDILLQICQKRIENRDRRSELESLRSHASSMEAIAEKEAQQLADAEGLAVKSARALQTAKDDLEKCRQRHEMLVEDVQRSRERDAAIEYRDMLTSRPADALAFLCTTLKFHPDPAILLAELGRLRDHYRAQLDQLNRNALALSQGAHKARRELAKKQQSLNALQCDMKRSKEVGKAARHELFEDFGEDIGGKKRLAHADPQAHLPAAVAPSPLRRRVAHEPDELASKAVETESGTAAMVAAASTLESSAAPQSAVGTPSDQLGATALLPSSSIEFVVDLSGSEAVVSSLH